MASVNQQVIADKLRISRTSVSRSFSNHPAINPETRARVFAMAAKLGYRYTARRPPAHAHATARGTVGVLIALPPKRGSVTETFQYMLGGISERLRSFERPLDVRYFNPSTDSGGVGARALRDLHGRRWSGAILIYAFPEPVVVPLAARLPCVSLVEDYADQAIDCIDIDQSGAMHKLILRLAQLGHRRFGFLSWPYTVPTPWVQKRFAAYVESLFRLELPFDPHTVVNVRPSEHRPVEDCTEFVIAQVKRGVTAWVCAADHQAYSLVQHLQQAGLRVPQECSVTGFDGIDPPRGLPQLATVKVPYWDMGIAAVGRLLNRVEHPSSPRRHILIAGQPVYGATTGIAPGSILAETG
jgi:LacI family transcriptional regulator